MPAVEPSAAPAQIAKQTPAAGWVDLPWLSAEQNASRRMLDSWAGFEQRAYLLPLTRAYLRCAVRLVSQLEQDVLRVNQLLKQVQTKHLNQAEWSELNRLAESCKRTLILPWFKAELVIGQLAATYPPIAAEATLLQNSLHRLVAAHDYLTPGELPWQPVARLVQVTLPLGTGTTALVASRAVPGSAFGRHFARGYYSDSTSGVNDKARLRHVPELAQTSLTNAGGETLFSGLRHGFIHSRELDGQALLQFSDEELKGLVGNLLISQGLGQSPSGREAAIAQLCWKIRASPDQAADSALSMRQTICEDMAKEILAAALISDPYKFAQALQGWRVDINLLNVAFVNGQDFASFSVQRSIYQNMRRSDSVALRLLDPAGVARVVHAKLQVRQFIVSADENLDVRAEEELIRKSRHENPPFNQSLVDMLLGSTRRSDLGGAVGARVGAIRSRAAQLGEELMALSENYYLVLTQRGAGHPDAVRMHRQFSRLKDDRARFAKNANTLMEAGLDLKRRWHGTTGWSAGIDSCKQVGARLALIAYLMGETPVLSCLSGKGLARQVESEVNFIATAADNMDGHLTPLDSDQAAWGAARAAFDRP